MINPLAEKLAVFWAHGTADSQIPYSLALTGMRMLEKYLDMPLLDEKVPFGRPGIKFDTYKMDHQLIDPVSELIMITPQGEAISVMGLEKEGLSFCLGWSVGSECGGRLVGSRYSTSGRDSKAGLDGILD